APGPLGPRGGNVVASVDPWRGPGQSVMMGNQRKRHPALLLVRHADSTHERNAVPGRLAKRYSRRLRAARGGLRRNARPRRAAAAALADLRAGPGRPGPGRGGAPLGRGPATPPR